VVSHRYTGDADAARRFAREAQTVAGLEHPNIVRTLRIEALGDDAAAIVSRYVPGETLRAALRAAGGRFDYARAAAVLRDLAAALAYAHARRIVHRDVKPENVFLEERDGRALLADFGIARPLDVDSPLTVDGASLGHAHVHGARADHRPRRRRAHRRVRARPRRVGDARRAAGPWQGETLYAVLHRSSTTSCPTSRCCARTSRPTCSPPCAARSPSSRRRVARRRRVPRAAHAGAGRPPRPPGAAGDQETMHAGQTVRIDPARATAAGGAPTSRRSTRTARRGRTGPPTPVAARAALPARADAPSARAGARARRWAALAVAAAALATVGAVLARRQGAAQRAYDAAVTGMTDAHLDSLLRAAAAAGAARRGAAGRRRGARRRAPRRRAPRRSAGRGLAAGRRAPGGAPATGPPAAGTAARRPNTSARPPARAPAGAPARVRPVPAARRRPWRRPTRPRPARPRPPPRRHHPPRRGASRSSSPTATKRRPRARRARPARRTRGVGRRRRPISAPA
jgi:hypothetical protein